MAERGHNLLPSPILGSRGFCVHLLKILPKMSAEVGIHPFLTHLVALLSIYELRPTAVAGDGPAGQAIGRTPVIPLPRYDGPRSPTTDSIERSLNAITSRMKNAEEKLGLVHPWLAVTSNHRSTGPTPPHMSAIDDNLVAEKAQEEIDPFSMAIYSPNPTYGARGQRAPSPMSISLQGINNVAPGNQDITTPASDTLSPTSPAAFHCPTCRRPINKASPYFSTAPNRSNSHTVLPSPNGSPLVVPPGPLSTAAFESGLSAVEELRLLKQQVQDVARVCKAVAEGDLTQKIEVGVQGPVMVQLKDVINTMVDKLGQFAKEVTRVSLEVGTEGRLGGQAVVVCVSRFFSFRQMWRGPPDRLTNTPTGRRSRQMARINRRRQPTRRKLVYSSQEYRARDDGGSQRRFEPND